MCEARVAQSLQRVAPTQYEQRRHDTLDKINPIPYIARFYGHKLHMDQSEKLAMFGVTHVIARDSYSGKIVASCTMPVKNSLAIYETVYRYINIFFSACVVTYLHTRSLIELSNVIVL